MVPVPGSTVTGAEQSASHKNVAHDLLLIPTNSEGRVHDDGVITEFSMGVAGWDRAYSGESTCVSLSVTGVYGGAIVTNNFTQT